VENQPHVAITEENKNWLTKELMPDKLELSTSFLAKGNVDIQAPTEVRLKPGFATNLNPTFHIFIRPFATCNAGAPLADNSDQQDAKQETTIQLKEKGLFVNLYPNPANDNVTINAQNKLLKEIRILYADGRLISTVNPQTCNYQLDLKDLKEGMYFIQIIGESGSTTQKLIVRH
jgi:hypothetical protein